MPAAATPAEEHQERWKEIARDPSLQGLPYKAETNCRGQIVLSPHKNRHTFRQKALQKTLDELLPAGEAFQELATATTGGTKQADVIWASEGRLAEMKETGDPTTPAPEICVEVLSSSTAVEEIREKRGLYSIGRAREGNRTPGFNRPAGDPLAKHSRSS